MKWFLLAAISVSSSLSPALVIEQAACTTSDGAYSVNVIENQGTGPVRPTPGPMTATIKDAKGDVVYETPVELFRGFEPISFGRPLYRDIDTAGDVLKIEGPSTNFKNYILSLATPDGKTINDENLVCTIFLGQSL